MRRFRVAGMSCEHCRRAVTRAVQGVETDSLATEPALVAALAAEGYSGREELG